MVWSIAKSAFMIKQIKSSSSFLFLTAAFLLIFVSVTLNAQNRSIKIDGKVIPILDNSFTYKDTIQKLFLKSNSVVIWNLRTEITKLVFDHCNQNEVNLLLYSDSTGAIVRFQLITGTGLPRVDSLLNTIFKNYADKFKPAIFNNFPVRSWVYVKYRFHNKSIEDKLLFTKGNYDLSEGLDKASAQINSILNPEARQASNECDDDTYFFNEGSKYFQQGDFGKAIYNFSRAVNSNPLDMDATYNLGLSYQKADKLKKACKCFSDGIERSDTVCLKAFNKFCKELSKK
jgi:tetratricopeptide (TPR) repeat protein